MTHRKTCKCNTQKKLVQTEKLGLKTETNVCVPILNVYQTEAYLAKH